MSNPSAPPYTDPPPTYTNTVHQSGHNDVLSAQNTWSRSHELDFDNTETGYVQPQNAFYPVHHAGNSSALFANQPLPGQPTGYPFYNTGYDVTPEGSFPQRTVTIKDEERRRDDGTDICCLLLISSLCCCFLCSD